jgi:hypothetical protein
MKKIGPILIIGVLIFLTCVNIAQAGFGVSPPKVLNRHLLPGSHFEQTIYLIQSKPEKDLLATIEIDAPEIEDWITIDRGLEFTIPAGAQQFPIKVDVRVPFDAEFKHYGGEMWVKTMPADRGQGMVTVALGAIITFDLTVSAEEMYGFVIRGVSIEDAEEGRPIKVGATLQNIGNVEDRPTKIHLDVYDQYHNKLLYSGDATDLKYVDPFQTKTIIGKFRAKLVIGSYWADIKVYKDDNIIVKDKRVFYIVERTGLLYKIFSQWYSWVILIILILAVVAVKKKKELREITKRWKSKKTEKKKKRLEKKLKKLIGV